MAMQTCKECGKEISTSAKTCPNCGAKISKPIYKKWWFWLIIIFILAIIANGAEETTPTSNTITTNENNSSTNLNYTTDRKVKQATDLYNRVLSEYQNGDYENALNKYNEYISKYSDVEISEDIYALKNDIENAIPHITAQQLCKEYSDNEVRADELYKGKLIIVTGTIDSIGKDILDTTYVSLSDGKQYSFDGVQCYFKDTEEISKVANLNKGSKITIQGRCEGKSIINISFKNCVLK